MIISEFKEIDKIENRKFNEKQLLEGYDDIYDEQKFKNY